MRQIDLVCNSCPLIRCDETSLYCAFRWATNPNPRQRALKQTVKKEKADRREYWKSYYRTKKAKKIGKPEPEDSGKDFPSDDQTQ